MLALFLFTYMSFHNNATFNIEMGHLLMLENF